MNFKNKTVVITGGASGIGAACAQTFFDAGANVAILDVAPNDNKLPDARRLFLSCNVANAAAVKQSIERVFERFGAVHFLINNAGIQRYGSVTETSEEDWDEVMNINLKSYFLCSKYALPSYRFSPRSRSHSAIPACASRCRRIASSVCGVLYFHRATFF